MKRWMTIAKIEFYLLLRNPFAVFFNVAFPTLMLVMYATMYGNEPTPFFDGLGTVDATISGYIGMVIAVAGIMTLPLSLAEYKERKVYKRLDATPIQKEKIMLIQVLTSILLSFIGIAALLLVGFGGYSLTVKGTPFIVITSIVIAIGSLFAFGFFLAGVSKSLKVSNLLCFLSYFIMIFLSGATMPLSLLPESLVNVSRVLPLTYVIEMLNGAFRGLPLQDYLGSITIVIIFGMSCAILGWIVYRKQEWS